MKELIIEYPGSECGAEGRISLDVRKAFKKFDIMNAKKIMKLALKYVDETILVNLVIELSNQLCELTQEIECGEDLISGGLSAEMKRNRKTAERLKRYIAWLENGKVI